MTLALLLAIPLAACAVSAVARGRAALEAVNVTAFALTFLLALAVAAEVLRSGAISLWNGFLYADALSALVILLNASVALVCSVYAVGYLREDERAGALDGEEGSHGAAAKLRMYYSLTPLLVFSLLLVALANNLGVMWAAIELTTLASVFLVTFYGNVTSLEAAWKYAMIGGVGLSMALFGTVLTYYAGHKLPGSDGLAGLNWSNLVQQAGQLDKTSMRMAFILVLLGYGTKAGLAPMHTWKPDAYSEAPVPSAAILAAAMLNCAIYGLVRFYVLTSRCLGAEYPGNLLLLLGLFSMGIAVPFVLVQKNFRRMLAYSTIDQAGMMVTALGIGGKLAAFALMLHMTFHTVAKSLLFLSAGNVYQCFKTDLFQKIKGGVLRVLPLTGAAFCLGTMAVVGMPPFSLFQSEFLMIRAAFGTAHFLVGALFILFGLGVFTGVTLHVSGMLLGPAEEPRGSWQPWRHTPIAALAILLIAIGFWLPAPLLELVRRAAAVVSG
ncbi:MAG: proton-conducting transporter membrane subunit [Candidatus Solibacter sp.]|jgi:hydrogenase-4 component F